MMNIFIKFGILLSILCFTVKGDSKYKKVYKHLLQHNASQIYNKLNVSKRNAGDTKDCYTVSNRKVYIVKDIQRTFYDAGRFCKNIGMQLTEINNQYELDTIGKILANSSYKEGCYWLGYQRDLGSLNCGTPFCHYISNKPLNFRVYGRPIIFVVLCKTSTAFVLETEYKDTSLKFICDNNKCPLSVDGNWGTWTDWSSCGKTCGISTQKRTRLCNNPSREGLGKQCEGKSTESRKCFETLCRTHVETKLVNEKNDQEIGHNDTIIVGSSVRCDIVGRTLYFNKWTLTYTCRDLSKHVDCVFGNECRMQIAKLPTTFCTLKCTMNTRNKYMEYVNKNKLIINFAMKNVTVKDVETKLVNEKNDQEISHNDIILVGSSVRCDIVGRTLYFNKWTMTYTCQDLSKHVDCVFGSECKMQIAKLPITFCTLKCTMNIRSKYIEYVNKNKLIIDFAVQNITVEDITNDLNEKLVTAVGEDKFGHIVKDLNENATNDINGNITNELNGKLATDEDKHGSIFADLSEDITADLSEIGQQSHFFLIICGIIIILMKCGILMYIFTIKYGERPKKIEGEDSDTISLYDDKHY